MIEYRLIRSNRRTLSLSIDGEGELVVRAPLFTPKWEIEAFIRQKQSWIAEKQSLARSRQTVALVDGAAIPFLGGTLTLRFADVSAPVDQQGMLFLPKGGNAVQWALQWRMTRAKALLAPRVETGRSARVSSRQS